MAILLNLDPSGKRKLKYRRVYSHRFQTTIAGSVSTTPNSIQCPFKGALYSIWCGVGRLGDGGVKVV